MKFSEIPQFPRAHYEIDVGWDYLEGSLERWKEAYGLELDPDFQRAHVWSRAQQIAYVEYVLMGGEVAKNITWNCVGWDRTSTAGPIQLVDGKQRLEAARAFLRDELPVFGHRFSEFKDRMRYMTSFRFRVCSLEKREDVLRLYLNINAGGTPHTKAEIERVRKLLKAAGGQP